MGGRAGRLFAAMGLAAGIACGGSGPKEPTPPPPPPSPPPALPPPPAPAPAQGFQFGTEGPWPVESRIYGSADGILETPVVGFTTDETQNRWVATHDALYLLRPGEAKFRRFDAADGLHLPDHPERYCNDGWASQGGTCPSGKAASFGAAGPPGISEIVGGGKDEVFVGYFGSEPVLAPDGTDVSDPGRHDGKIDRVRIAPDGSIAVDRFDLVANDHGGKYWHDRTVWRLVYDHFIHGHALYAGTNHGVAILFPDQFREPNPGEWFGSSIDDWMGDHLHAVVCYHKVCTDESGQRMGDWRGLALDASGNLWHAGRWTAGLITFDPVPPHWVSRNGAAFARAFGDPYDGPGGGNPPVFEPPQEGDAVNLSAVTVCPDGKVWFASGSIYAGDPDGRSYGIASWDGRGFAYHDPSQLGMSEQRVADLLCLPDGRLVAAGFDTGLVIWDPATGSSRAIRSGALLPADAVQRIELDRMVKPEALHVSTAAGAAVIRPIP
jgi:hypothetical protein